MRVQDLGAGWQSHLLASAFVDNALAADCGLVDDGRRGRFHDVSTQPTGYRSVGFAQVETHWGLQRRPQRDQR